MWLSGLPALAWNIEKSPYITRQIRRRRDVKLTVLLPSYSAVHGDCCFFLTLYFPWRSLTPWMFFHFYFPRGSVTSWTFFHFFFPGGSFTSWAFFHFYFPWGSVTR